MRLLTPHLTAYFSIPTSLLKFALLLTLVSGCALLVTAQDSEDELKIESSIVVLNATIKDGEGKTVPGLKKSQFKVFEDGVEQKLEFFSAEETPFAAVILLDTSGSMEERVSMARSAAIRFLFGLRESDNASIYRFDSKVILIQDFSNSRDISESIFELKADGMTRMNDAIYEAVVELGKRPEKRKAIIVLSDGEDTMSKYSVDKALKMALKADVVIYTVDMSTAGNSRRIQNQGTLRNLAEKTGGIFIETPGGAAMRTAFGNIVQELGTQYTLGYSPANTKKDGKWRAIELKVARPGLTIRTKKGYSADRVK